MVQAYNSIAVSHLHSSKNAILGFAVAANCNLIVLFMQQILAELILLKIQNIVSLIRALRP
jgi:hypothetical protein